MTAAVQSPHLHYASISAAALNPYTKTLRTRTPSPSSSICSRATSVDDLGDIRRIDKIRPMYDASTDLERGMGTMEILSDEKYASSSYRPRALPDGEQKKEKDGACETGSEVARKRFPEEEDEDLLRESNDRFVLFPIKYREIWQAYKASQASFWTAEELDLGHDMHDWQDKLTENERFFILRESTRLQCSRSF